MTWDEVKELGSLYAIGALDENTARAVEEYLTEAPPEQQREIAEWREVAALMPMALPSAPVPAHLKDRLMNIIAKEEQGVSFADDVVWPQPAAAAATETEESTAKVLPFAPTRRTESSPARWLLIAATVLLTFTSGYLLWQNMRLNNNRNDLARELAMANERITEITSATTKVIAMSGDEAPQASAKLVWNTKRQTWEIYFYNLPVPPSDKEYQLWYVTKDSKISAAVFRPNNEGGYNLKVNLPPGVAKALAATAITLEPKGGSPQPTGNIFLKGAI